jgi:hypothetical protein
LFDQSGTSKATQNPAEIARIQAEIGSELVEIYADEISGTKGRWRPSPSQARSQCRQRGSKIRYLALK